MRCHCRDCVRRFSDSRFVFCHWEGDWFGMFNAIGEVFVRKSCFLSRWTTINVWWPIWPSWTCRVDRSMSHKLWNYRGRASALFCLIFRLLRWFLSLTNLFWILSRIERHKIFHHVNFQEFETKRLQIAQAESLRNQGRGLSITHQVTSRVEKFFTQRL